MARVPREVTAWNGRTLVLPKIASWVFVASLLAWAAFGTAQLADAIVDVPYGLRSGLFAAALPSLLVVIATPVVGRREQ